MPRVDPVELESLDLEAPPPEGFTLHDVWLAELEGGEDCTIPELRRLITPERLRSLGSVARALFRFRSLLGKVFRLDRTESDRPVRRVVDRVPQRVAKASSVPPGTQDGPFMALYVLPHEAAYQVRNATVHAVILVALVPSSTGRRLLWATYLKPVGRITPLYMGLIDPFRRRIVYPALESWLRRTWSERG